MVELKSGQELPREVRAIALLDVSGKAILVGDLLGKRLAIFVFLRHFGCLACLEHLSLWKPHFQEFDRIGARVIFIGVGKPEQLREFIAKTGLANSPADAYTEPTLQFHAALGLTHSVMSTIGPSAVLNALRALGRGNLQSSVQGDPLQQGGVLVVTHDLKIALLHRERMLGDFLNVDTVLKKVTDLIAADK